MINMIIPSEVISFFNNATLSNYKKYDSINLIIFPFYECKSKNINIVSCNEQIYEKFCKIIENISVSKITKKIKTNVFCNIHMIIDDEKSELLSITENNTIKISDNICLEMINMKTIFDTPNMSDFEYDYTTTKVITTYTLHDNIYIDVYKSVGKYVITINIKYKNNDNIDNIINELKKINNLDFK